MMHKSHKHASTFFSSSVSHFVSSLTRRKSLLSLELCLDGSLQSLGLGSAGPSALDLAILANQELFKVPLDSLQAHDTGLLGLHPLEHGLGLVAIDVGFAENREGNAVVELAELLDGVVGAGVLGAELVAGEAEEFDLVGVGGLEFCSEKEVLKERSVSGGHERKYRHTLVELLETFELRGETALAGGVDDEDDLALQLGQIIDVALLCALRSVSRPWS